MGAPAPAPREAPPPSAYTPKHLAERILTSRSAIEGERKLVTVLFADVKGSMELAEQVDPEEWHRILDHFFQVLARGVHRFEGTINQYTGDGIMALFGAPIAHEDHAQRACYAALHLRDDLRSYSDELRLRGLSFSVRMGINSGDVVVGKIGDDLRMDYTAHGPTVGLAARMEQIAAPGSAYLTEHTASLVEGFFRLRDLGRSRIKGVPAPVRIYELEGVGGMRRRLDVARTRGLSRFVGRAREMEQLEASLRRALEGAGLAVGVVGEPGVGKSRLCLEFVERCRGAGVRVYEAACPSYGRTIPFSALLELLRSYFEIGERDTDQSARERIAGRLLLADPRFDAALPVLFDFLGIPDPERPAAQLGPEARREQLFDFVRRLVHTRRGGPARCLMLEDLQWIDPESDVFLAQLVESIPGTQTLLLLNFRPEYDAEWMQPPAYESVPLVPLGAEETFELLRDLLGEHPSVAGIPRLVAERTGGNPFFVEELVQILVESGSLGGARGAYRLTAPIRSLEIPKTVQAVLIARIDRLPETEKRVLQTAAVIGTEFSEPVLRRVTGLSEPQLAAALGVLRDAEFVYEEAIYPHAVYAFKHPLTQDVAYRSQLSRARERVHSRVARALYELYADRLDEQAALLANHWEAGGEALEAARWHRRAAERAARSDRSGAVRHWRKVRELAAGGSESPETLELALLACWQILQLGQRTGLTREEVDALFQEGHALAERSGDVRTLALLTHAVTRQRADHVHAWRALAEEAAALAERTDDRQLCIYLQVDVAHAAMHRGRLREALAVVDRALGLLARDPELRKGALGLRGFESHAWFRGILLMHLGRLDDAFEQLSAAVARARERGELEHLRNALSGRAELATVSGDAGRAMSDALEAVELAERLATPFDLAWSEQMLGLAHGMKGDWPRAVEALERALATTQSAGTGLQHPPFVLAHLAEARLGAGQRAAACEAAETAVELARSQGGVLRECRAQLALARVCAKDGAAVGEAVRAALDRADELAQELGVGSLEPFIREERAALTARVGDREGYARELRGVRRMFAAIGARGHAERVARELDALER